ncbi:MAG: FAD-binding oxidoreductase [Anaerolineae bacterium]|jgi:glycine/D-amino acid oxidase-like deaminating enzyme|nr:FAD-binding oxidoreductase [Anaerolineae bacterium]
MAGSFDAVVVGAGYIGVSVAYHLSKVGLSVALIDRGKFAAAASRGNYGNIQIQDMELEHSVDMIQRSAAKFETLEQQLDWKVGLRRMGGLLPVETESQWRLMEERSRIVRAAGFDSHMVPVERLPDVEPLLETKGLLGGLYHDNEGQVDPFQFLLGHLVRARQKGLREFYDTEVTGFLTNGGRMAGVQTIAGDFYAGAVVLCTGARTRQLGKMLGREWDVRYVLGQAMVSEPVEKSLRCGVASASFFERTEEGADKGAIIANMAISQSPHGHLLMGEAMYEADHYRLGVPYPSLPGVSRAAVRYFPSFGKLRVLRGWCSPVAHTEDGCPWLGWVPGIEGLIIATAFRSTVISTPLAGETVAQLVTQGKCDWNISRFSPERNIEYAN